LNVLDFVLFVLRTDANRLTNVRGRICRFDVSKRRLCGLSIGVEGVLQPTPVGGGLCESQPALAPQNAGKFLD
jgi:hypothetical protein